MSRTKSFEYPSPIRASIISHSTPIHITNSFDYRSNLNRLQLPRFSSFSQYPINSENNMINRMNEIQYSRHIIHTNMCTRKVTRQSLKKTEAEFLPTKIPCIQTQNQEQVRSNSTRTIINTDIQSTGNYSLYNNEFQQNIRNQHAEFIAVDDSSCGSLVEILPTSANSQNLKSIINMDKKKNTCFQWMQLIFTRRSKKKNAQQESKPTRGRYCGYTSSYSSLCCVAALLFGLLLLLATLTPVFVLIYRNKTTTTTLTTIINSITTTTTSASNSVEETTGTATKVTMETITTETTEVTTTTITSRKTSCRVSESTTISSTDTTAATTKTITMTSAAINCGQSCLNQSWIDSSSGLALWPFDGSYIDIISGYNGIPSAISPTFVTGYFGQAASFNASAQQAVYTSFIPLNNVSFTIAAWIKPIGYPNPTDNSIVGLCPTHTANRCLHITIRSRKLYFGFYNNDVRGRTTISLNKWIHVAFVFDARRRTQTIFLNGIQDGHAVVSSVFRATSGNFTIGVNEGVVTTRNNFQGYIDQLSISRRAKPSCEILQRATLAAYFKFDSLSPYTDSGPNTVAAISSTTSIITGYKNQAILLTGSSSSYFQTRGFTSLGINNQPFSVTLWIQPQILSGTLIHLSTSSSGTGSACFPLLGFASNGAIVAQVLTSNASIVTASGPVLPLASSWVLIVQTWSSTNGLNFYVNDTLVSSVVASTFLGSGTTPNYLTLGNCLSGCSACPNGSVSAADAFTGAIDDWRIYSRELASTDVCTLFSVI